MLNLKTTRSVCRLFAAQSSFAARLIAWLYNVFCVPFVAPVRDIDPTDLLQALKRSGWKGQAYPRPPRVPPLVRAEGDALRPVPILIPHPNL